MPQKKQETFTVTDRRLFTSEGDARSEISQEEVVSSSSAPPPVTATQAAPGELPGSPDGVTPPAPTTAEQEQQADAYRKTSKELDARVELSGHSAKDLEMTFERFMASLYMSAMMQL
jgi:hypothetical protein